MGADKDPDPAYGAGFRKVKRYVDRHGFDAMVALEAIYIHVLRDGWGPYPRLRREILGLVRAANPERS